MDNLFSEIDVNQINSDSSSKSNDSKEKAPEPIISAKLIDDK